MDIVMWVGGLFFAMISGSYCWSTHQHNRLNQLDKRVSVNETEIKNLHEMKDDIKEIKSDIKQMLSERR